MDISFQKAISYPRMYALTREHSGFLMASAYDVAFWHKHNYYTVKDRVSEFREVSIGSAFKSLESFSDLWY